MVGWWGERMERVLGLSIITIGALVASVGVVSARERVRHARRAHQKTEAVYAAMPEDWSSWFLGGFSGLAMGTLWLRAAAGWLVWTLAGVCLIGFGSWLFWPFV